MSVAISWANKSNWPNVHTWSVFQYPVTNYGTAHVQVYKLTCVMRRASKNFACNLRVGLVQHEEYIAREQLLMG